MNKIALILALFSVALLFGQFIGISSADNTSVSEQQFSRKANLALRRTAHYLLAEQGDSTSRILPVEQLNAATYQVRLEKPFEYGRIPALLKQSLEINGIDRNYDVALIDCENGELQLGYNVMATQQNLDVTCAGREQKPGCYNLQITFNESPQTNGPINGWLGWAAGILLLSGAYVAWTKRHKPTGIPIKPVAENCIKLGQMLFSFTDQSITIDGKSTALTYREAKLLNLFVQHPNQLLERDFILKSVWEDEGIIVGRSVDVFVSRLRKLLQADTSLRIATVHGVGYRLEVQPDQSFTTS